jgi:hypothetical protein
MGRRGPWCLGEACLCVVRAGEWLEEDDTGDVVTGGGRRWHQGDFKAPMASWVVSLDLGRKGPLRGGLMLAHRR